MKFEATTPITAAPSLHLTPLVRNLMMPFIRIHHTKAGSSRTIHPNASTHPELQNKPPCTLSYPYPNLACPWNLPCPVVPGQPETAEGPFESALAIGFICTPAESQVTSIAQGGSRNKSILWFLEGKKLSNF